MERKDFMENKNSQENYKARNRTLCSENSLGVSD